MKEPRPTWIPPTLVATVDHGGTGHTATMPTRQTKTCKTIGVSPHAADTAAQTPKVTAIAVGTARTTGETETTRVDTVLLAPTAIWKMAMPLSRDDRHRLTWPKTTPEDLLLSIPLLQRSPRVPLKGSSSLRVRHSRRNPIR